MSVLQETRLWVSEWTKIAGFKISGATQRQHFSLRLLMSFPVFSISFKNHLKDNIVHLGLVESIFIIRNKHVRCRRKFSMHFTKETPVSHTGNTLILNSKVIMGHNGWGYSTGKDILPKRLPDLPCFSRETHSMHRGLCSRPRYTLLFLSICLLMLPFTSFLTNIFTSCYE